MASRRQFLKTSSALAASSFFPECCLAVESATGRKPLSFIVVSDTHVGYRGKDSARKQWEKTASELADQPGDFVLHLGDVVDGGTRRAVPGLP